MAQQLGSQTEQAVQNRVMLLSHKVCDFLYGLSDDSLAVASLPFVLQHHTRPFQADADSSGKLMGTCAASQAMHLQVSI